jgi:replicative DNA helicase
MELEQSVLGALLLDNAAWPEVAALLREDDFYPCDHRLLFRAIGEMLGQDRPCDFVTLGEQLRRAGQLEEAGGIAYLGRLALDTASAANVRSYAAGVREYALRRGLVAAGTDIAALGWEPQGRGGERLMEEAEARLSGIGRGRLARSLSMAQVIEAADQAIIAAARRRGQGLQSGIPSGIACLDARTGGWQPGTLAVVAARPGLGKTALLNQIAVHAARHGHAGLVCSLEMSAEALGLRAMATAARVNVSKLARGMREQHEAAAARAVELAGLPLWIDTESYALSAICAQITEHHRREGIAWAAVDHIGLVEADGWHSRNDQLGHITRSLKKLAKRLQIPLIALSQLNRTVERERRRPMLADLRDSGNIEQDADLCLFVHSEADDSQVAAPVELGLLKHRGGRKGWLPERVVFHGDCQEFREEAAVPMPAPKAAPPRAPRQAPAQHWQDAGGGP